MWAVSSEILILEHSHFTYRDKPILLAKHFDFDSEVQNSSEFPMFSLEVFLLQPLEPEENTKIYFVDATSGNNIPRNFMPAIERVSRLL